MQFLSSLVRNEVGDRFEGIVLRRRIITHHDEKALVIDVSLTEPRTQGNITAVEWAWWLKAGQEQIALYRALKDAGAPKGAPFEGDWVASELVGFRPGRRGPKKLYVVEYQARTAEK